MMPTILDIRLLASVAILAILAGAAVPARADEGEFDVEAARESLTDSTPDPNWYDAETDAVRSLAMKPDREWDWDWDWDWNLRFDWSWLVYVAYGVGIAALVALLIFVALGVVKRDKSEYDDAVDSALEDQARIEALPVRLERGAGDLLGEARRNYERGDYNEAIIYLFSYQLVELDRHQALRLAKGKTNRQYLRELRDRPPLAALLAQTMVAFEDVYFGGATLDRTRFEACWNRLDEFHAMLGGAGP